MYVIARCSFLFYCYSVPRSSFGNKTMGRTTKPGLYVKHNDRSWSRPCHPSSMARAPTMKLWLNSWSWSTRTRSSSHFHIYQTLVVACCRERKFARLSMLHIQIVTCILMAQWHGDAWIWIWFRWIAIGKQARRALIVITLSLDLHKQAFLLEKPRMLPLDRENTCQNIQKSATTFPRLFC